MCSLGDPTKQPFTLGNNLPARIVQRRSLDTFNQCLHKYFVYIANCVIYICSYAPSGFC